MKSIGFVILVAFLLVTGCGKSARDQAGTANQPLFHGLSLQDAPRTTRAAELADLFMAEPPASQSYKIRADVVQVYREIDGTVYHLPDKNRFYVQHDPMGSSTMTYYGPFDGDPTEVMNLPKKQQ